MDHEEASAELMLRSDLIKWVRCYNAKKHLNMQNRGRRGRELETSIKEGHYGSADGCNFKI